MKRVAAAIALLAVAAGLAVWSGYVFESRMNFFENELLLLIDAPEEELAEQSQRVADLWEERADFLHTVFIHEGIDELERIITSLPMTLEYSGRDELILQCVEGINLIKNLKACEKLTVENVL